MNGICRRRRFAAALSCQISTERALEGRFCGYPAGKKAGTGGRMTGYPRRGHWRGDFVDIRRSRTGRSWAEWAGQRRQERPPGVYTGRVLERSQADWAGSRRGERVR